MKNENPPLEEIKKEQAINKPFLFLLPVSLLVVLIDQLTKYFIFQSHNHFKNYNFAFSLPVPVVAMYFIYLAILGTIIYHLYNNFSTLNFKIKIAWVVILAAAFSNIFERVFLGYVRDFIYINFYNWVGVYNLADFFIIAGILMLVFLPHENDI